jgi:hypothetical protein
MLINRLSPVTSIIRAGRAGPGRAGAWRHPFASVFNRTSPFSRQRGVMGALAIQLVTTNTGIAFDQPRLKKRLYQACRSGNLPGKAARYRVSRSSCLFSSVPCKHLGIVRYLCLQAPCRLECSKVETERYTNLTLFPRTTHARFHRDLGLHLIISNKQRF